jgi:hypothetical protein
VLKPVLPSPLAAHCTLAGLIMLGVWEAKGSWWGCAGVDGVLLDKKPPTTFVLVMYCYYA